MQFVSKYASAIAVVAFLVALSALGFQTFRVSALQKELEGAKQTASDNLLIANQNAAIVERVKSDFSASLSSCFADYADLSARFDSYRAVIADNAAPVILREASASAGSAGAKEIAESRKDAQAVSCEITAPTPISRALNDLR